jgi:hypothetical protein
MGMEPCVLARAGGAVEGVGLAGRLLVARDFCEEPAVRQQQ